MKVNFYDEKSIKKNLRTIWKQQTDADYSEGAIWYQEAHEYAVGLADQYKVPLIDVVGTISALSPMTGWDDNKKRVETYYETGKIIHFSVQQRKVELINSLHPTEQEVSKILNGLKTVNFFESILKPDCPKPYTVDRWMIRAALNQEITQVSDRQYQFIKEISLKEAKRLKTIGSQHQAIVWCVMRNK